MGEWPGWGTGLIDVCFGVDYQLVWRTMKERFSELKPEIVKVLRRET